MKRTLGILACAAMAGCVVTDAKLQEVRDDLQEMAENVPSSPLEAVLWLVGVVGSSAISAGYGVNRYRNRKRRGRGERVD